MVTDAANSTLQRTDGTGPERQKEDTKVTQNASQAQPESQRPVKSAKHLPNLQQNRSGLNVEAHFKTRGTRKPKRRVGQAKRAKVKSAEPVRAAGNEQGHAGEPEERPGPKDLHLKRSQKTMEPRLKTLKSEREVQQEEEEERISASKRGHPGESFIRTDADGGRRLREREIEMNMPLQQDVEDGIHTPVKKAKEEDENKWSEPKDEELPAWTEEEDNRDLQERQNRKRRRDSVWEPGDELEGTEEEDPTPPPVFDTDVHWSQTFQVNHLDLQARRSDWIDLQCNISGNLLLKATDALPIVKAFVEKLNEKHQW